VQIFGPFFGQIDDSGENIELQKPGTPDSGFTPYVTVDRVSYESGFPWPTTPNGSGPSLLRKDYNAYGNDVINWAASTATGGTPGRPNYAPTATGAFNAASQRAVAVKFTEDVSASLQPADLTIVNLSGGSVPAFTVSWNPATQTAEWVFGTELPDGNYRATLNTAGINDWAGNALVGPNQVYNFFFLGGDLNQDRAVNNADFQILRSNYGQSNKTYADGDLNRDGKVDFIDYQKLGLLFGRTLAAPTEPVQAPAVSAPVTSTPTPVAPRPIAKPVPKKRDATLVPQIPARKPAPQRTAFATKRIK
jgi:hypothetical protein